MRRILVVVSAVLACAQSAGQVGQQAPLKTSGERAPSSASTWQEANRRAADTDAEEAARARLRGPSEGEKGEDPARARVRQLSYLYGEKHWKVVEARVDVETEELVERVEASPDSGLALAAMKVIEEGATVRDPVRAAQVAIALAGARATLARIMGTKNAFHLLGLNAEANVQSALKHWPAMLAATNELVRAATEVYGDDSHPTVASAMVAVGNALMANDRYADALVEGHRARDLLSRTTGANDLRYMSACQLLGRLYTHVGDLREAQRELEETRTLQRSLKDDESEYATTLRYLGDVYLATAQFESAERELLAAQEIRDRLGQKDLELLGSLAHLYDLEAKWARVLHKRDDEKNALKQASGFEARQLTLSAQLYGRNSAPYGAALQSAGSLSLSSKDYPAAAVSFDEALRIARLLGDTESIKATLIDQALLSFATKDYDRAQTILLDALEMEQSDFWRTAPGQSERQQLLSAARHGTSVHLLLSSVRATASGRRQEISDAAYDAILPTKGMVSIYQRQLRALPRDEKTRALYDELASIAARISSLYSSRADSDLLAARKEMAMQELAARQEHVEEAIAQRARDRSGQLAPAPLTAASLRTRLPPDSAFIDFRYVRPTQDDGPLGEERLLALVTRPGVATVLIDLGKTGPLEAVIDAWRAELTGDRAAPPRTKDLATQVRDLIWAPLASHLGPVRTVFISPEGATGRVPFAALPDGRPGHYLVERLAIAIVPTPQAFLDAMTAPGRPPGTPTLLAVGGVDFDAAPGRVSDPESPETVRAAEEWRLANAGTSRVLARAKQRYFPSLPETSAEIEGVTAAFQRAFPGGTPVPLGGPKADVQTFRSQSAGRTFLHIASHGFFWELEALSSKESGKARSDFLNQIGYVPGEPDDLGLSASPGLLTGIALAGANHVPMFLGTAVTEANGVLHANEVMSLDLAATDLVVLSACETGLGRVAGDEGVLGLQRAFHVAGARTVISSLWRVDKAATRELMDRFYLHLWGEHRSKLEALQLAQIEMAGLRSEGSRQTIRSPGAPFLWAGWTLSGAPN